MWKILKSKKTNKQTKKAATQQYFADCVHAGIEHIRMRNIRVPGSMPKADVAEGVA